MAFGSFKLKQSFIGPDGRDPYGASWCPKADIYCSKQGWLIKLDLAGVEPENLELTLTGSRLRVSGIRRDRAVRQGQQVYSMEIAYNRFEREFELPADIEKSELMTEYLDGMLLIHLKTEAGKP